MTGQVECTKIYLEKYIQLSPNQRKDEAVLWVRIDGVVV